MKSQLKNMTYNECNEIDEDGIEYFVVDVVDDDAKYYYKLPYDPQISLFVKIKYEIGRISYWNGLKRHRLDGPAVIRADGSESWFVDGKQINCSTQQEFEQMIKLKGFW